MAVKILYLPINSASLPHYFGRGIILPSKYYINKPDDLQSGYDGSLLLSPNMWLADADCSLGIVLADAEEKKLRPVGNSFLFAGALPISRINQVYFKNSEQKKNTVYNINAGSAYLPERLVQVVKDNGISLNPPRFPEIYTNETLTEKNKRFDILLGGIAFMSVAKAVGSNFPKDYFSVLGTFNKLIKDQVLESEKKGLTIYNDFLTGVFLSNRSDTPWEKWQSLIFETVNAELIEKLAAKEKVKLDKKFGMINLDSLNPNSHLFTLSLLATYGNKKSRSIEDLISELRSFSDEKSEEIALIFGLNVRYSGLRNHYHAADLPVKFKLESRLDYYIIESIYQFVFNNVRDSAKFEYIDSWVPLAPSIVRSDVPHYKILDIEVLTKNKPMLQNFYTEKFERSSRDLQQSVGDFGKQIFESTKDAFQNEYEQEIRRLKSEIISLKQSVSALENRLQIELSISTKFKQQISQTSLTSRIDTSSEVLDGLEDLDIKELKKIAKSKGISPSKTNKIKSTKSGLDELIVLIRETKTLL